MHFSIGYQLPDEDDSIPEIVADYPGAVSEVYFALPSEASGRSPLINSTENTLAYDLGELNKMNVGAVLLFNAACYGGNAMSYELERRISHGIKFVENIIPLAAVTTTSLFIARYIKKYFPHIAIRASVNMRISSIAAMKQLVDCFDGYYMQRELNRNHQAIAPLKTWCDANNKSLHLLANSGCLYDCAFQSFHDNMVAHESEAALNPGRWVKYPAPCWEFLDNPDKWHHLLQNTWIRPEDLHHYEKYFDTVKLATRMHSKPRIVLGAYIREKYRGNILDLLEPGHASLPGVPILDNSMFPADWYQKTSSCGHNCHECSYCESVFLKISKNSNQ